MVLDENAATGKKRRLCSLQKVYQGLPTDLHIIRVVSGDRDACPEDSVASNLVLLGGCRVVAKEGELRRREDDHVVDDGVGLHDVLDRYNGKKTTYLGLDLFPENLISVSEGRISLVVEGSRNSQTATEGIFGNIYSVFVETEDGRRAISKWLEGHHQVCVFAEGVVVEFNHEVGPLNDLVPD